MSPPALWLTGLNRPAATGRTRNRPKDAPWRRVQRRGANPGPPDARSFVRRTAHHAAPTATREAASSAALSTRPADRPRRRRYRRGGPRQIQALPPRNLVPRCSVPLAVVVYVLAGYETSRAPGRKNTEVWFPYTSGNGGRCTLSTNRGLLRWIVPARGLLMMGVFGTVAGARGRGDSGRALGTSQRVEAPRPSRPDERRL